MQKKIADYSFLSALAECPRKAEYGLIRRLTSGETSLALHLGSTLHIAIDHLYTHDWDVEGALEAASVAWGDFSVPLTHKHSYATFGHIECIIRNYVDDRRGDDTRAIRLRPDDLKTSLLPEGFSFQVDAEGYIKLAETPLAVDFGDFVYAGMTDYPNLCGGAYSIWDNKSTRQWLSDHWAQKYAYSHQMRGYVLLLKEITGLPFDRAYINGIYTGKEASDADDKWAKRKTARSHLFGPFIYSEQHLEETKEWARYWIKQLERFEADNYFPQNDKSCYNYGQECEFATLCHRSPHIRESVIRQLFTVREFNGVLASGADSDD